MITRKDEHSIRSSYPVPESPLELLIAKEEPKEQIVFDVEWLIFLADFAAQHPDKWRTVKERVNDPRSSLHDLAGRMGINLSTVKRHLNDLRSEAKKWNGSPLVKYEANEHLKINEADGSAQGF